MPSQPAGVAPAPLLMVHNGSNWITGSERCLLDLMARLDRTRYRPVLLCNADAIADEARALGVAVHRTAGWADEARRPLPSRALVREAREIVERHGIRLIHANDADPVRSLVPVARAARIPLLAHLHIISDADERRWSWLHQVSHAVGVSHASLDGLLADGFPAAHAEVIYNAVDAARLSRGAARALRAELGIAADAFTVAVVGSLIPRKGVDAVLPAIADLHARGIDAHALLVGDGAADVTLRRQADELGIGTRVHFLGRRGDVGAVLRDASDVFVSMSRQEAFPLSLLEAGLFGLPIVASAIAPHAEGLVDGVTGELVPLDGSSALADALSALARDPARRTRLGDAGRARIQRDFLIERYVERFDATYTALLAAPSRRYGWVGATRWPHGYWRWAGGAVRRRLGLRR